MRWQWPFVPRSEYEAVLADRERIRGERDQFAKDRDAQRHTARLAARQFAESDATNRRLNGRLIELGRRLSRLTESDPQYAASLEQRLARALRACAGYRAQLVAEGRRIRRLQARIDDAVGLHYGHIEDSRKWQPGYQKPKAGAS